MIRYWTTALIIFHRRLKLQRDLIHLRDPPLPGLPTAMQILRATKKTVTMMIPKTFHFLMTLVLSTLDGVESAYAKQRILILSLCMHYTHSSQPSKPKPTLPRVTIWSFLMIAIAIGG